MARLGHSDSTITLTNHVHLMPNEDDEVLKFLQVVLIASSINK
ncbi:hypothetical protein [Peribacillus sp. NPDC097895]